MDTDTLASKLEVYFDQMQMNGHLSLSGEDPVFRQLSGRTGGLGWVDFNERYPGGE